MDKIYDFLDVQINDELRINTGFNNLISPSPFQVEGNDLKKFFDRYNKIKEFQKICLELFQRSMTGQEDPEIATLLLNELPQYLGKDYHKTIPDRDDQMPVFFRTDEIYPGKIIEIQCPGSSWGLYQQLFNLYEVHDLFKKNKKKFAEPLTLQFKNALEKYLPWEPVVHHLLDNASIPNGMRYFISQTRRQGLKYFGYDKGITSYDCNFIRSHAFLGLTSDNFRRNRFEKYLEEKLKFDLFPSILFDQKMTLLFPFFSKTRQFFTDEIRELFPFSSLVTPQGVTLEDGSTLSIDEFSNLPQSKRKYFLKYAGSDLEINWGSKSVFYLGKESQVKCKKTLEEVLKGYKNNKYWKIQKAYFNKENSVEYITRDNELVSDKAYAKLSGFYGPSGLMGILAMQRTFPKVHGSPQTILSIV